MRRYIMEIFICLFLITASLSVYLQTLNHEFINLDDHGYVVNNNHIKQGISFKSISWAFTSSYAANWHPLTWLSHMVDYKLYGINPYGYHLTNLLFHIANSLLLFLALRGMTGALWQSAFVAALFALHPLHVESVAWVSERKDVLSCFFWILTMWTYSCYSKNRRPFMYRLTILFFVLGLLSKPMLVTMPFVLLLLDYWPLKRFNKNQFCLSEIKPLMTEKIPFLILAVLSCVITVFAQAEGQAVTSLVSFPLSTRVANALVSYSIYIRKMMLPYDLAMYYAHLGGSLPGWQITCSLLFLVSVSFFVFRAIRGYPFLLTGWLWYLGTLVPVIGFVQVGYQAMADRYTYIPLTGLFIMIAWGGPELLKKQRHKKTLLIVSACVIILSCIISSWFQTGTWHNNFTLYGHSLRIGNDNFLIRQNLGHAYFRKREFEKAVESYTKSLEHHPVPSHVHLTMGYAFDNLKKFEQAVVHYSEYIKRKPNDIRPYLALAAIMEKKGRLDKALVYRSKALKIDPESDELYYHLAKLLEKMKKPEKAIVNYKKTIELKPDFVPAYNDLTRALEEKGRFPEAAEYHVKLLSVTPDDFYAHYNLGRMLGKLNQLNDALNHYKKAVHIKPDQPRVHYNLANVLFRQEKFDQAIGHYKEALRINPNYAEAHNNLGSALAGKENYDRAIHHYARALRINPEYTIAQNNLLTAIENKNATK